MKDTVKINRAVYEKARRERMRLDGKCACGKPLKTKWQCEQCINSRKVGPRKLYRMFYLKRMKMLKRCQCGGNKLKGYTRCQKCLDYSRAYNKRKAASKVDNNSYFTCGQEKSVLQ